MASKSILGRLAGSVWSEFTWLRLGTVTDCCEHGDELSGSGTAGLAGLHSKTFEGIEYSLCIRKYLVFRSSQC